MRRDGLALCGTFSLAARAARNLRSVASNIRPVYNVYMTAELGRPLSVRLPEELRARVAAVATATRRSQGDVVREVLERDLGRLEWEQRVSERAAAHRSGRAAAVPAAEVDRLLGLEGISPAADALDNIR